ncbi:hypothetical protein H0H93_000960 [Arthromyces matolae]|nr:hypothetical protein H0H93_000960 [Arthromyces matolae]
MAKISKFVGKTASDDDVENQECYSALKRDNACLWPIECQEATDDSTLGSCPFKYGQHHNNGRWSIYTHPPFSRRLNTPRSSRSFEFFFYLYTFPSLLDAVDITMNPLQFDTTDTANFFRAMADTNNLNERVNRCECPSHRHTHHLRKPLEGVELDLFLAKNLLLLKPDPLPTTSDNYLPDSPDQNFWYAMSALTNLGALVSGVVHKSSSSARLSQVIRDHWEIFWKWMKTGIHRAHALQRYPLQNDPVEYLIITLNEFMTIIRRSSRIDSLRHLLFATKADICFDLWYLHLKHPELDKYLTIDICPDAFIVDFFQYGDDPYTGIQKNLHHHCDLPKLIYQRTKKLFGVKKDYKFNPKKLFSHTSFLLAASTLTSLLEEQIDIGCITLYTGILIRVSDGFLDDESDLTNQRSNVIDHLVGLLLLSFMSMDGIDWLRRSIECGLLLGLLQAAPSVKHNTRAKTHSTCVLMKLISKHFSYISILRAFNRAMGKPDHLKAYGRLDKVGTFWEHFFEMQNFAEACTRALGDDVVRKCNYPACKHPDADASFKRCSKCEDVLYCSVECQRADWTDEGHKPYCIERAKLPRDRLPEYALSFEDNAYLEIAFRNDLLQHGLIYNPDVRFNQGDFKKFTHPRVLCDHTSIPPITTIVEKEDGTPGHLTFVSKFLHGKRSIVVLVERALGSDWPLGSASDLHNLLHEGDPKWWDYDDTV